MRITGLIPDHILTKMPKADRPEGKAGMTNEEAQVIAEARNERELQRQLNNLLLLHGAYVTVSRMDKRSTTKRGTPDFIFCYKGRYCAWEVKTPKGKCSPEQDREMEAILKAGGSVSVIRSVEHGLQSLKMLEQMMKG